MIYQVGQTSRNVGIAKALNHGHPASVSALSARAFSIFEHAYRPHIVIAIRIRGAMNGCDMPDRFVEDPIAKFLYANYFHERFCRIDGESFRDGDTSRRCVEKHLRNFVFYRCAVTPIPEHIEKVVKLAEECLLPQPEFIWVKGEFQECP